MQRPRAKSRRRREPGFIITLVAVFMLFVVGAMAALSIDVVTFYTARSEAQLAADAAALAGARVLANSGMTSSTDPDLTSSSVALCQTVGKQVGAANQVSGQNIDINTQITVTCTQNPDVQGNPTVRAQVQVTVPAFFARIWGTRQIAINALAIAEAYNPTWAPGTSTTNAPPVAPLCVKPWLLPNVDPTGITTNPIFSSTPSSTLLGQGWPWPGGNHNGLYSLCSDCTGGLPVISPGGYYPGKIDADDFPAPTIVPSCSTGFNSYQLAVAGCVPQPIVCGSSSSINIDNVNGYSGSRDADTVAAASCLTHDAGNNGDADSISATSANPPFEFLAGNQNPIAGAVGSNTLVSDSLVTVPVISNSSGTPTNPVTIIGFVQLFLNPNGNTLSGATQIPVTIVNLVNCTGTNPDAPTVYGNGASPVAVRLIAH